MFSLKNIYSFNNYDHTPPPPDHHSTSPTHKFRCIGSDKKVLSTVSASTVAGVCQAKHHSELQLHEASCKCPRCCVWWYYLHRAHAQKGTIAKHVQQPGAYDQPRVLKECAVRIESNNLAKVGRCTNGSRMKTGVSASVNRRLLATAPARCYAHEY